MITPAVVWQYDSTPNKTGSEPNVPINTMNREIDTSGAKCVPIVDLTHDDDDSYSHMLDIPLQLPANACVSLSNFALVTFSQTEGSFFF